MNRTSVRLYRALLRLLPEELQDAHGEDMAALLAEELTRVRDARGRAAWLAMWAAAIWDLLSRAPYEHGRRLDRVPPSGRENRMQSFVSDLRFAVRSFARQKGATVLVLFTLTLAVAANSAVFALLDGFFFRPFPFPDADRLVYVNEQAPQWNLEFTGINYPDFHEWRTRTRSFDAIALYSPSSVNLADGESSARVEAADVTYDFGKVLGIQPVLGRFFTAEEDRPKGPPVVMIGYALWQTRFAGARDVLGKTLRINSVPHTIVGVLPREAEFPGAIQLWQPLGGDKNQPYQSFSFEGLGRLKAGVTVEQARRDLLNAHSVVWQARDTAHVVSPRVDDLRERFAADFRVMGKSLGVAVVLVLLIACANVGGAMLARAIFRQREIGIRIALGASAARVSRQLLTESLALAVVAGILGMMLGWWGLKTFVASAPDQLPPWVQLSIDARTVAFSLAIVGVTAVLFGLVPSLQVRRHDVRGALAASSTRTTGAVPQRRMLNALVVIEIALAAVLLAGSGLLLRTYRNLQGVDPGFRVDNVASFRLALPSAKYADGNAQRAFYERVIERLRVLPSATDAGGISCAPFGCHLGQFYEAEGMPTPQRGAADPVILTRVASAGYFRTMGIPLLRGRFYEEHEPTGLRPVVVNESFAKLLWPNVADPLGRRIRPRGDTSSTRWLTVVGITKDEKHYGVANPSRPGIYATMSVLNKDNEFTPFTFVVHTASDPTSLFAPIREAVRELDPELPLFQLRTMQEAMQQSLALRRMMATALAAFAGIALTLAIGGIYAVLSYVVGRRRHEIGIRMALGAQRGQVVQLVVRQGLRLVGLGVLVGLPLAFLAARLMSSILVGVSARDPLTYAGVALLLALTGIAAALVPARRAARVDPTVALAEGG